MAYLLSVNLRRKVSAVKPNTKQPHTAERARALFRKSARWKLENRNGQPQGRPLFLDHGFLSTLVAFFRSSETLNGSMGCFHCFLFLAAKIMVGDLHIMHGHFQGANCPIDV